MNKILPVLQKDRTWLYIRLIINGLFQALAVVAILLLVRYIFDSMVPHPGPVHVGRILWMGLGLILVGLGQGWLVLHASIDASRLGQKYAHALRLHMYDHLLSLPPRTLQRRTEGSVIFRFTGDLAAIRRWITRGFARGMVMVLTIGLALVVLARLNWLLALAVILVLVIELVTGYRPGRLIRQTIRELRRIRSHFMGNIGEQVSALAAVQVYGQQEKERRHFFNLSERMMNAAVAQARAGGVIRALTRSASTASRAVILVAGALEVADGRTTMGTVAAALTVAMMLSSRIRDLAKGYTAFQKAQIARLKIRQFLEIPPAVTRPTAAPDLIPGPGRLEFDRITFEGAIFDFSAIAEAGSLVALVGPNGAGKSTLLALASCLIGPEKGRILLDGQDIATRNLASVRRAVSMASPELPLLRGSVNYNLTYRWPEATAEELAHIRQLCGLDPMLAELSEGEEARIIEAGKNLSLGQRQRIGLARAMLGHPRILLLDEIDANLDAEAGKALDRVLEQFEGTIIMVSHQPERIAKADAVWHMQSGRLVKVEERPRYKYHVQ